MKKLIRICLLSQAITACRASKSSLINFLEGEPDLSLVVDISIIKSWTASISRDIKGNRSVLEQDGPHTIPEMESLIVHLQAITTWMKSKDFTHFVDDLSNHMIHVA